MVHTAVTRPAAPDGDVLKLQQLWLTVVRNRWLALSTALLVAGIVAVYTWTQRPVYAADASIRLEEQDRGQNLLSEASPLAAGSGKKIETQVLVLRSRKVAGAVADSLHLAVRLLAPNRPRDQVLRVLEAPAGAGWARFDLRHATGDAYTVEVREASADMRLPARVQVGVPFRAGADVLAVAPGMEASPPERISVEIVPFRKAVDDLQTALSVIRPDARAQVLVVHYESTDRLLTAAVPNAVTRTFIADQVEASRAESRSTVAFLRQQVATYDRELLRAESELQGYRERQQVVSLPDEASEQVKRLADQQARYDALRSERDALSQLLDRVSRQGQETGGTSPYRQLSSFPVFLSNNAVQNILKTLTDLENERAQKLVGHTLRDPDVEGLTARIHEMELELYQLARNYLSSLNSQIASDEASLRRFGGQLQTIPAREVQFARLSRQQTLLANLYTLLTTRLKEEEIREAAESGGVQPIDPAIEPNVPIAPRKMRNVALGLLLGLIAGVGAAALKEALDTKLRTPDDVRALVPSVPILATIPRIRPVARHAAAAGGANGNGNGGNGNGRKRGGVVAMSPEAFLTSTLVTRSDPRGPASEAYRTLRTNITFSSPDEAPRVVVVTSAMPGDGKSTSSSNLAVTLAQQGGRTLLIDADLRKGLLHRIFDVPQEPGLTHVLMRRATLEQAIQEVPAGDAEVPLWFIPSGIFPPNPAEMLGSPRMRELMAELRGRFDNVIIDAPPLNLVTDAALLGTMADATLLVGRAGVTDKRALAHAVDQLRHLRAPVSGIVFNDFDHTRAGYGQAYGYGYGDASTS
jgi:tyrosine-protein kinase Etk/Wzc